jgi:Protein of unknown function (DUF3421).
MRKTTSVAISMSVALILALFSAEIRRSVVAVNAVEVSLLPVETDSSTSLPPTPQNASFVWALPNEEGDYPGYRRVEGGTLDDGTKLSICRAGTIPGKVYKGLCLYPYAGAEGTFRFGYYEVLLTNAQYEWKAMEDVSRSEIKSGAVKGGSDKDGADTLYICRKKMNDGVHHGKYSYKNRLCYIPWGGKEYPYKGSFEVLFR